MTDIPSNIPYPSSKKIPAINPQHTHEKSNKTPQISNNQHIPAGLKSTESSPPTPNGKLANTHIGIDAGGQKFKANLERIRQIGQSTNPAPFNIYRTDGEEWQL